MNALFEQRLSWKIKKWPWQSFEENLIFLGVPFHMKTESLFTLL